MNDLEEELSKILGSKTGDNRKLIEQKIEVLRRLIYERQVIYDKIEEKVIKVGDLIIESLPEEEEGYNEVISNVFDFKKLTERIQDSAKEIGINFPIPFDPQKKTETNYLQGNSKYTEEQSKIRSKEDKTNSDKSELKIEGKNVKEELRKLIENISDDEERQKLATQIQELRQDLDLRNKSFINLSTKISKIKEMLLKPEELPKYYNDVVASLLNVKRQNAYIRDLARQMGIIISVPLYPDEHDTEKFAKEIFEKQAKIAQDKKEENDNKEENKLNQDQEPKQDEKPNEQTQAKDPKRPIHIQRKPNIVPTQKEYIDIDSVRKIAKDFYYSKNEFANYFTLDDKIFMANNTLKTIKEEYSDIWPNMQPQQEKLFYNYIKFMCKDDGYYLDPATREKIRNESYNQLKYGGSTDIQTRTDFYNKFFGDCQNEQQVADRYYMLMAYSRMSDDEWKTIDNFYVKLEKNIIRKDAPTKTQPENQNNENLAQMANKIASSISQSSIEPIHIEIQGNKMTINGMEFNYEPYQELAQDRIMQEVEKNPLYKKFFTHKETLELEQMQKTLYNEGDEVLLDQNIIYAILQYCSKDINPNDEQSFAMANNKLKQIMFNYMKLSNGDFEIGDETDNSLNIEYDLTKRTGLSRKEFKELKEMAYESRNYANIKLKPLAKFIWFMRNLDDKVNSVVLLPKKEQKTLQEGNPQPTAQNEQPQVEKVSDNDFEKVNPVIEDKKISQDQYIREESDKIIEELKQKGEIKDVEMPSDRKINRMVDEILDDLDDRDL